MVNRNKRRCLMAGCAGRNMPKDQSHPLIEQAHPNWQVWAQGARYGLP